MSRIIINYDDDIPDLNAIHYVNCVMSMGRCSGTNEENYCFVSKFKDDTIVIADRTKTGTDVFKVFKRGVNNG